MQSFVVFIYYSARNKNNLHTEILPYVYITLKSVMFDVDDCPPLLTLTRVNALLAFRSET